ncbi:MAG: hypothetical protein LBO66_05280 [Deltaproteobacteria bacterium]|jgi:putative RNA 2'-phosphotransferase|nr:hypothetical protein [Deltaproteobacteria bacterium]
MTRKIAQARDSLEKLLIYALGVAPDEMGLTPGPDGFVPFKELLAAIRDEDGFRGTTEAKIKEILNAPQGKSPLETEGPLIRVIPALSQLPVELSPDLKPPKELFLGLKPNTWRSAHIHGLAPRRPAEDKLRLFSDRDMALRVAKRFCPDPISIKILAAKAREAKVLFIPYSATIFLAEFVPAEFLMGPPVKIQDEREAKALSPKAPDKGAPPAPGVLAVEPQVHRGKKKGKYQDSPDWKTQTRRDRRDKG